LGGVAAGLFVRIVCTADSYSCMHAGIFWGLLGDLAGLIFGIALGASYARRVINEFQRRNMQARANYT
jgi:hypothetical protein